MKIWFQISYSGQYDQFKPFTAIILWVSKKSTTTLKFSEIPDIPQGITFWLVEVIFLNEIFWILNVSRWRSRPLSCTVVVSLFLSRFACSVLWAVHVCLCLLFMSIVLIFWHLLFVVWFLFGFFYSYCLCFSNLNVCILCVPMSVHFMRVDFVCVCILCASVFHFKKLQGSYVGGLWPPLSLGGAGAPLRRIRDVF